jgi:hypothetical protein
MKLSEFLNDSLCAYVFAASTISFLGFRTMDGWEFLKDVEDVRVFTKVNPSDRDAVNIKSIGAVPMNIERVFELISNIVLFKNANVHLRDVGRKKLKLPPPSPLTSPYTLGRLSFFF